MLRKSLLLGLFAVLFAWPQSQSYAQGAGTVVTPTIVVLDIGAIRRDAASVKSIRDQIVSFQGTLQGDIQKEQEALSAAQQNLAKKQTLLSPEAFAEERQKFEQRVVGVQQMVQNRRRNLEGSQGKAMLQVERALNEIVANMAAKNGYSVVLRRAQVVIVDTSLDITAAVLHELNAKLPTVAVEPPAK